MNVQRCLEILREVKDVAFATVDEKGLGSLFYQKHQKIADAL